MNTALDRIERERQFHDARFADGDDRSDQDKYYDALSACFERYFGRMRELAHGATVLEYGCSHGAMAMSLSDVAARVDGIDISEAAVNAGLTEVKRRGITNVGLSVQNAEAMSFADNSFDLVFGSGILHHLDYSKALAELNRVLKPGGVILFVEPLAHNPVIAAYRHLTPKARTEDEHPLVRDEFLMFDRTFEKTDTRFYGLASLGCVPFRRTPLFGAVRGLGVAMDAVLLRMPGLKWWAWYALMEGRKA